MTRGTEDRRAPMRGSTIAALAGGLLLALAVAEMLHAAVAGWWGLESRKESRALAEGLGLTDAALFTEARYTRHLSLADLHSAFQDAPMAVDHFPAGSLTPPPRNFPKGELRPGTGD